MKFAIELLFNSVSELPKVASPSTFKFDLSILVPPSFTTNSPSTNSIVPELYTANAPLIVAFESSLTTRCVPISKNAFLLISSVLSLTTYILLSKSRRSSIVAVEPSLIKASIK